MRHHGSQEKVAYLIEVMGFPRELAKALIIDAAAAWNIKEDISGTLGHGIVPVKISDILDCKNNEIKFIYDRAINQYTYSYTIPIPTDSSAHYPYIAKATLCYFPMGTVTMGIDYTDTDLSIKFGRYPKRSDN